MLKNYTKKILISLLLTTVLCLSVALAGCVKPETKVSAEQWKDVFNGYTDYRSVSVKITYVTSDKTEITTVRLDVIGNRLHTVEQYESTYEAYYCEENGLLYGYSLNDENKWEKQLEEKSFTEVVSSYLMAYAQYFYDLKDNFDVFEYDDVAKRYVVTDKRKLDGICFGQYDRIICAFADGKLTYCQIDFRGDEAMTFELYDYNRTKIKLPKAEVAAN